MYLHKTAGVHRGDQEDRRSLSASVYIATWHLFRVPLEEYICLSEKIVPHDFKEAWRFAVRQNRTWCLRLSNFVLWFIQNQTISYLSVLTLSTVIHRVDGVIQLFCALSITICPCSLLCWLKQPHGPLWGGRLKCGKKTLAEYDWWGLSSSSCQDLSRFKSLPKICCKSFKRGVLLCCCYLLLFIQHWKTG